MKQDAKAMLPRDTVPKTHADAVKVHVRFQISNVLLKTANTMMTANAMQRLLKFPRVNPAIAEKQSVILSEWNKNEGA